MNSAISRLSVAAMRPFGEAARGFNRHDDTMRLVETGEGRRRDESRIGVPPRHGGNRIEEGNGVRLGLVDIGRAADRESWRRLIRRIAGSAQRRRDERQICSVAHQTDRVERRDEGLEARGFVGPSTGSA
jgi:hypothetical protein